MNSCHISVFPVLLCFSLPYFKGADHFSYADKPGNDERSYHS